MNALPTSRRCAVKLAQFAARVLPGARSNPAAGNRIPGSRADSWADAMRRELDYIEDDRAALRWALGCVVASCKARLAARSGFIGARDIFRHAAACAALMLVIGFALLGNAESQTEPPQPAGDETACDTPDGAQGARALPGGAAGDFRDAGPPRRIADPAPASSCAGRDAPARTVPSPHPPP